MHWNVQEYVLLCFTHESKCLVTQNTDFIWPNMAYILPCGKNIQQLINQSINQSIKMMVKLMQTKT